jgi:hypothetical protein
VVFPYEGRRVNIEFRTGNDEFRREKPSGFPACAGNDGWGSPKRRGEVVVSPYVERREIMREHNIGQCYTLFKAKYLAPVKYVSTS